MIIVYVAASTVRMWFTHRNVSAEGTLTWENGGGSSQSPPVSPRMLCLWHPQVSDTPHPTNTQIPGIFDWALPHWSSAPVWPFGLSTFTSINEESLSWKGKHFPPSRLPGLGAAFPRAEEVMQGFWWSHHSVYYCSSHLLKHFQHKLIFSHVFPLVFHYSVWNFSFRKMFSTHQNRNDAFEFLFHQITNYFVIKILNWFPLQRQELMLRWKQL